MTPPSLPLFSNAVNLQMFRVHSEDSQLLSLFVFPTLTSFELSMESPEEFWALYLLDFLEASPMLQVGRMKIDGAIFFDGVPQERVVVLPDVESLSLVMSDGRSRYNLAVHISCPSAKYTSLTHEYTKKDDTMIPRLFPALVSWNAIVRQYTRSPVEEIALEMKLPSNFTIECSLEFRSPDATVIRLHHVLAHEDYGDDLFWEVFSQVCRTIRDLTPPTKIKRLRVGHISLSGYRLHPTGTINEVVKLFRCVGPLEELIFHHCDMEAYLAPLSDYKNPVVFPPTKELTISHPLCPFEFEAAIVRLAESQHALGVPFERVTVRMDCLPAEMAERLRPWVGAVHCYNEVEST